MTSVIPFTTVLIIHMMVQVCLGNKLLVTVVTLQIVHIEVKAIVIFHTDLMGCAIGAKHTLYQIVCVNLHVTLESESVSKSGMAVFPCTRKGV